MKSLFVLVLLALIATVSVSAVKVSHQRFVTVGEQELQDSLEEMPTLQPALVEVEAETQDIPKSKVELVSDGELLHELYTDLHSTRTKREFALAKKAHHDLARVELLAHQMGVPVLTELDIQKGALDLENDLLAQDGLAMLEVDAGLAPKKKNYGPGRNAYSALDKVVSKREVNGLDIYIVNTPLNKDPDNEIRPVKPPHPMSAELRERERRAKILRNQLVHDIPQPKAKTKPRTPINTLSAYEPSILVSPPLARVSRLLSSDFDNPLVGGAGALPLQGVSLGHHNIRFAQVDMEAPGTGTDVGKFVRNHTPMSTLMAGSSFDHRDGPPARLDDLLPLKAQIVESLRPEA